LGRKEARRRVGVSVFVLDQDADNQGHDGYRYLFNVLGADNQGRNGYRYLLWTPMIKGATGIAVSVFVLVADKQPARAQRLFGLPIIEGARCGVVFAHMLREEQLREASADDDESDEGSNESESDADNKIRPTFLTQCSTPSDSVTR